MAIIEPANFRWNVIVNYDFECHVPYLHYKIIEFG